MPTLLEMYGISFTLTTSKPNSDTPTKQLKIEPYE